MKYTWRIKNTLIKAAAAGGCLALVLLLSLRAGSSLYPLREGKKILISEGEIPPRGSLYNELARKLPAQETLSLTRRLEDIYSSRRIRPGDNYRLYHTTYGAALKFVFNPDPLTDYVVERSSAGLTAYEQTPEIEERLAALTGEVQTSLYAALAGSGITDPTTIMNFANIFQWQVDFLTEVRQGDRFGLIYKQYLVNGEPVRYGPILAAEYNGRLASARGMRFEDGSRTGYYTLEGDSLRKQFLRAPLNYTRISSHFTHARRHPIHRVVRPHLGIDYAAPTGTPVSAVGAGRVTFVGWKGGWGNTVRVRHNATYSSQYAHFSRFARGLRVGQRVEQGQVIGYVGMTGTATGPHLCFRFEVNGRPVNYLRQEFPPADSVSSENMDIFNKEADRVRRYLSYLESGYFFRNPSAIDDFTNSEEYMAFLREEEDR